MRRPHAHTHRRACSARANDLSRSATSNAYLKSYRRRAMDSALTNEQQELQRLVREFCTRECPPELQRKLDEELIFPEDIWHQLAGLGLMGVAFPDEYGGAGGDIIDEAIVVEELARGANPIANLWIATVSFGGYSILKSGNERQRAAHLPRIASGELAIALALTEPDGGTDLLNGVKTRASLNPDGTWQISGHKIFITGAEQAGLFVVVAVTDPNPPKRTGGMTMFLVDPATTSGIEIIPQPKVGSRVPHSCFVFFDDVEVPGRRRSGRGRPRISPNPADAQQRENPHCSAIARVCAWRGRRCRQVRQ